MQSGIYIEVKGLLGDNISLLNELEILNVVTTLPGTTKPRLKGYHHWRQGFTVS